MVLIDTVYQRVLNILNKEQRGYITPQEFNLLANHAQMDIFEQYFYDINQFDRIHGNQTEYSDMLDIVESKIALFETSSSLDGLGRKTDNAASTNDTDFSYFSLPSDTYRIGVISYKDNEAERVTQNEYLLLNSSQLTKPTNTRLMYIQNGYVASNVKYVKVRVFGADELKHSNDSDITITYIRKPQKAEWAYTNVNGNPLYNVANTVNFDLHESEENELVIKIAALSGVIIKDPSVYQIATTEENKDVQQEKS